MPSLTYGEPVFSQSGELIPAFLDGTAMYSRYNPQREVRLFAEQDGVKRAGCVLIFGLGNGSHIAAIVRKNPFARIIVVEYSLENIAFLQTRFDLSGVTQNRAITICTADELSAVIPQVYLPALHGDFIALFQSAWKRFHALYCRDAQEAVAEALEIVKNDYAVQTRFGKLWNRNILENLKTASLPPDNERSVPVMVLLSQKQKTYIIAAGPSLDKAIPDLKAHEDSLIIAADTAYPALLRQGIVPDIVCSIDGQIFSARHFMLPWHRKTVLAADICCNPVIPRLFAQQGGVTLFTGNKHPLYRLFAHYQARCCPEVPLFPEISSGAGTVTVYCLDFARKAGFQNIEVLGADFAYIGGKPYCSGTYFEDQFHAASGDLKSAESEYATLMYRGKTEKTGDIGIDRGITTPLLRSYRESFQSLWIQQNIQSKLSFPSHIPRILTDNFFSWYAQKLQENLQKTLEEESDAGIIASCLPLAAWYRQKKKQKSDICTLLKLAYNLVKRYT
jgi:hypothetical protein